MARCLTVTALRFDRISRALVPTTVLLTVLNGCSAGTNSPQAASSPIWQPGAVAAASSGPAAVAPSGPALGAGPEIGVADPNAKTVAGAHLGRAEQFAAGQIAALPPPTGPGAQLRGKVPTVVSHGPRTGKRIALTFDSNMTDSMLRRLASGQTHSYASPEVIDELQKAKTPATFFLAGKWVEAYPQLTRRIAADPNFELASHSWAHEGFRANCYDLGQIPRPDMAADVERSFQLLAQYTPNPSRYFRFPGGCYDQAALTAIAPVGCTVVEYDDVSGDAFGTNPKAIEAETVRQAHPGAIVVLHITGENSRLTAAALPGIMSQLRAQGYDLVTLGALLGAS